MTALDWAGIAVALSTLLGALSIAVKFLTSHYLMELKPNGGSSMKDSLNRMEQRIDELYKLIAEK